MFIDSPLHNISGDSRNEIAQVLAKHLPDVQIVLFVTDTEYTSGDSGGAKAVREFLNPQTKVWKEWIINVTCTECKDAILYQSEENEKELVCKNCNKNYNKKGKFRKKFNYRSNVEKKYFDNNKKSVRY